jgi:predicted HAD superfamily phosphohydrolase
MEAIDNLGKIYYSQLKKNQFVDDTQGQEDYKSVESLSGTLSEVESGKVIKVKTFPKFKKVKLFRVLVSTNKTEYSGSQKSEVCPMPYALCPMPSRTSSF